MMMVIVTTSGELQSGDTGVSRYYLDIVDISVDIEVTPSCSSADSWPSSRAKHAGCVHGATGQVYILAGRCGTNL